MEIEELERKIEKWQVDLSSTEKKYIHYYSMRNFVFHYSEINDRTKIKVLNLFEDYAYEVEHAAFDFDKEESYELANKYMNPIANSYSDLGFKLYMKLSFVIFSGILVDILLLVAGVLSKIKYIPITTVFLLLYYLYLQFFKKPHKLVYGLFY